MFRLYGKQCETGVSVVVHCTGWAPEPGFLPTKPWKGLYDDGKMGEGVLKQHVWRNTRDNLFGYGHPKRRPKPKTITNNFLSEETDLLIGHMSIGVHERWLQFHEQEARGPISNDISAPMDRVDSTERDPFEYQYATFFRDATHKLVSGYTFLHANDWPTFEHAVDEIKQKVFAARERSLYSDGYSNYLLTPEQQEFAKKSNLTVSEKIELAKENLRHYNVVIGIVERMDDSLKMLQHLVDANGELDPLFYGTTTEAIAQTLRVMHQKTGGSDSSSNWDQTAATSQQDSEDNGIRKNVSRYSTGALIKALMADSKFAAAIEEYVKYDDEIYQYGLRIHQRQVHATFSSSSLAA